MAINNNHNRLIMPKQDGTLEAFYGSLKVYYTFLQQGYDWVFNKDFKPAIAQQLNLSSSSDGPMLIKKSEIPRYFNFVEYKRDGNSGKGKITERGKRAYNAYNQSKFDVLIKLIFESLLSDTFGRNNCAVPGSDSDIEPPIVLLKSINKLGYLFINEFAYILYQTHNLSIKLDDVVENIKQGRLSDEKFITKVPKKLRNKYKDAKFLVFFRNLGILEEDDKGAYQISNYVINNYLDIIHDLSIYNDSSRQVEVELADPEYKKIRKRVNRQRFIEDRHDYFEEFNILRIEPYDENSKELDHQNNRQPKYKETIRGKWYETNRKLKKTAIAIARYKCIISSHHDTFLGKDKRPFFEAHHIVPMAAQEDFGDTNLDRVENIVALCPTCHRAVHYGAYDIRKKILKEIFVQRKKELENVGILIDFERLFDLYYK